MDIIEILFIIAIILIIAIIAVLLIPVKEKKQAINTYFKETNNSKYHVRRDKGLYGEYKCYEELKSFEDEGARFLFNLVIPTKNNTTEIDSIMIIHKGIFVIESKNRSGRIIGDENTKYWTQIFNRHTQNEMYNPYYQNRGHIKAVKNIIGNHYRYYSFIVFANDAVLDVKDSISTDEFVVKRHQLYEYIKDINDDFKDNYYLSDEEIEDIYNRLYEYTNH